MGEITQLLGRSTAGDAGAREPLYRLLYPELMRLARGHLSRAGTLSLDPTALLHEAYLRALAGHGSSVNRHVYFAYASKVMHSVIVDYVRERGALKRGGDAEHVTLTGVSGTLFTDHALVDVEDALRALAALDERAFRVVEMRYFGGMSEPEIACALEVSLATVERDWRKARAFLYERLREA